MRGFLFILFLSVAACASLRTRAEDTKEFYDPRAPITKSVSPEVREAVKESLPDSRSGDTLIAIAIVVAGVLRGVVGLLKSPVMAGLWGKLPLLAQWAVMGVLTCLLAAFDSAATGAPWRTALATAVTGWFASWSSQKIQKTDRKVNAHAQSLVTPTVVFLLFASSSALAQEPRRKTDDTGTVNALGSVDRTSGWCDDATTTAANVWASSNVPTEVGGDVDSPTAGGLTERSYVRYVAVRIVDATDSSVPVCVRLGPSTGTLRAALTCTGTAGSEATNGSFLPSKDSGRQWHIEVIPTNVTPQLWIKASAAGTGAGVRYCVEVAWHQKG